MNYHHQPRTRQSDPVARVLRRILAGIGCLAAILGGPVMAAPGGHNVLFILTDNQPASILGAYGNPDVRTPHIDQLALEGVRFTRAYAAMVCVHPPVRR